MVKNIDTDYWTSSGSYPKFLIRLGNRVLFSAVDKQHGGELWATDGTTAGTVLVSDINPEPEIGSEIFAPVEMNGFVYFFATGEGDKKGLYRTDGTSEGTVFIQRFENYNYNNSDLQILKVNNTLYFEATVRGTGSELWKSDGTEAGTVLVKDINPGYWGSSPKQLTEVNGEIYFTANNGVNGIELWKTDGTETGTYMVIDFNGTGNGNPNSLISFQGMLFFSASSATGNDLWKTDGTVAGTQLVSSVANVEQYASYNNGIAIREYNGYLYFGGGPYNNKELWRSDGTTAGTAEFATFYTSVTNSSSPDGFTEFNGELYFSAQNGGGRGFYKTNGVTCQTLYSGHLDAKNFCVWNGILFFQGRYGSSPELWKTNGTPAGTVRINNMSPSTGAPCFITPVNATEVVFQGTYVAANVELWKSNGSAAGTVMIKDISSQWNSTRFKEGISLNDKIFFASNGESIYSELWETNGTTSGTLMTKDMCTANYCGSAPRNFYKADSTTFYFNMYYSSTSQSALAKSNGTTAGSVTVKNMTGESHGFIPYNGYHLFLVGNSAIARTDGTTAGTITLKSGMSTNGPIAVANGMAYFITNAQLWKTDGTVAGTTFVKTLGGSTSNLFELNGMLYFEVYVVGTGCQIWSSDGTSAGTVLFMNVPYNDFQTTSTVIKETIRYNNKRYFSMNTNGSGYELWVTDGTVAGTQILKEIKAGPWGSDPKNFSIFNGKLYFSADDGIHGSELWESDGTTAGTIMVKDINPGIQSSAPSKFTILHNKLYFSANDGSTGHELWVSDGTACSTRLIQDANPGNMSSFPLVIGSINNEVILNLYHYDYGFELWKYTDNSQVYETACGSYTWSANNQTYTNSGIYSDTIPSFSGCDSIVTLNLTILNPSNSTYAHTACNSYDWIDGNTYTSSTNTPTFVLQNAAGCDSTITLNLTITHSTTGTDVQTACDSLIWIDGNTYVSSTNTPTFVLQNAVGCDSTVTLNLTITQSTNVTDVQTACDSLTWIDGNTYTSSTNIPTFVLQNTAGCDSIITLNLTILSNNTIDIRTACDSYDWIDGNTYTSSTNTPTVVLQNAAGCDSIVTLNLTINHSNTGIDIQTACDSLTWIDGNTYYASTNTPTFVLQNAASCDSTVTLNLTITNSNAGMDIQTACDSYDWIDGNTYTSSTNTPTFVLQNAAGCDSLITLNLTITNSTSGTDIQTACDSLTWIDGNTYYVSTNTPTFVLQNTAGCDSTITLNLTILSNHTTDFQSVCDSLVWIDGNTYYSSTSTPTFVLQNAAGCDSIITLNLTITNPTTGTDVQTACDSYDWIDGNTYTSSTNTPTFILQNSAGCDSTVTLNLTITHSNSGTDVQTACDSYDWIDGNTYTSSTNTPIFVLQNAGGCDSTVTLNLTVVPALPLTIENVFVFPSDANTCVGEAAITISGNANFELDFDNGSQVITSTGYSLVTNLCHGVHDLQITDNCGDTLSVPVVIPVDSNYVFNNPFIDSLAIDSLGVTMTNCDIYYNSIDTAYIDSIWANGNTVNVIWNIVDSNGSNFDTTSYVLNNGNGVYWLQLSVFCPFKSQGEYFTVTEAIYFNNGSVSTAGLPDIGEDLFEIYPNPTNDQVHISFSGSEAELTVYDVQGKVVLKDNIQNQGIVSLQNFERGVYLFDFRNSQGHSVQRVVKQ
ncbi:ELWxxDGT repeat protein [Fluviicola sp.]|uniref:ELWxxDGT repeat protein n=1 Tax=Fluviicola sp. TaxID=1917219 RepID=UPI0026044BCB|nr:ELWxxDGT repeat protein [Fluviicola sp.]